MITLYCPRFEVESGHGSFDQEALGFLQESELAPPGEVLGVISCLKCGALVHEFTFQERHRRRPLLIEHMRIDFCKKDAVN